MCSVQRPATRRARDALSAGWQSATSQVPKSGTIQPARGGVKEKGARVIRSRIGDTAWSAWARPACGVFLALLSLYLLTHGSQFYTVDGEVLFLTTKALAERRTVALPPEWGLDPYMQDPVWILQGQGGQYFSKYGLGQPLFATVLYILAERAHQVAFRQVPVEGLVRYAITLFSPLLTALTGVLVCLLALRLGNGVRLSVLLALIWGTCTPAWPYTRTFFSEPLFGFLLTLAAFGLLLYQQIAGRRRLLGLGMAGLALGCALLTRIAGIVLLPVFLAYAAWAALGHPEGTFPLTLWHRKCRYSGDMRTTLRRWLPHALTASMAFLIPLGACIALLLWHNTIRWGDPFDNGYGTESFTTPLRAGLFGLLLSPGKGLLFYAPPAALALLAWPWFWRREPAMALICATIFGTNLVQYALWGGWWGGWCWGPRFLVPTLPFVILSAGPALRQSRVARLAMWLLAAAGFMVSALGALIDFNTYLLETNPRPNQAETYYEIGFSPILAHARYLFAGGHISVATFDMQQFGFDRHFAMLFPYLVAGLFIGAMTLLTRNHLVVLPMAREVVQQRAEREDKHRRDGGP